MARVTVATTIPADVEAVWADVERLETHSEWMADAESIEFVGSPHRGVGATMRVSTRVGPLHTTDMIRIITWEPQRSIGVVHEGLISGRGEFRLERVERGTRFTWDEDLVFPRRLGGELGAFVARPILRWIWKRNLARLSDRFLS
jgi:carbon monoxide dehydrogenase subunit G